MDLYRHQCSGEDDTDQNRFSSQAENDVDTLAVKVIFPEAYLFILLHHIYSKDIEEDEQGRDDGVHESRRFAAFPFGGV